MTRQGVAAIVMASLTLRATPPAAAGQGAGAAEATLDRLERALAAEPDSLRAGSEYRQAVIRSAAYDRSLAFFERLVAAHPQAANAHLNYGLAFVDKVPTAGSVTQVILASSALAELTKSIDIQPTWVALYTRGRSYLFWPRALARTPLAVADLEQALRIQKTEARRRYHARTYAALGDAYWKLEDPGQALATWKAGLAEFPDDPALGARLAREGDALSALLDDAMDYTKRVDTDLAELWTTR